MFDDYLKANFLFSKSKFVKMFLIQKNRNFSDLKKFFV